jgi:hypothetical protein
VSGSVWNNGRIGVMIPSKGRSFSQNPATSKAKRYAKYEQRSGIDLLVHPLRICVEGGGRWSGLD